MIKTDYSAIADRYDATRSRFELPPDGNLSALLTLKPGGITVLDAACGTGNWLSAQTRHFASSPVRWHGLDLSPDMLRIARGKSIPAEFQLGDSAALPYGPASFDLVQVNFAFHHFERKEKALDEFARVLRPGGIVSFFNISPDYMRRFWVYEFFPAAREMDAERFRSVGVTCEMLEERGFAASAEVTVSVSGAKCADLLSEARNRDMSQLAILPDADYESGLQALGNYASLHETFPGDFALHRITGRLPV